MKVRYWITFGLALMATMWLYAASYYTADVTITSAPVDGNTLTINGEVHTWKDAPTAATHIDIGATATLSADSLWTHVQTNGFANLVHTKIADGIRLKTRGGTDTLSATASGSYSTITFTTNATTTGYAFIVPYDAVPEPYRETRANQVMDYINTYGTNVFDAARVGLGSYTAKSIIYADGSGNLAGDATDFAWDTTNNRVGINVGNAPAVPLHIGGNGDSASIEVVRIENTDRGTAADNDEVFQTAYLEDSAGAQCEAVRLNSKITDKSTGAQESSYEVEIYKAGARKSAILAGPTELAINDDSADINFRVETDGAVNTLFVDAGADRVGIHTSAPDVPLHVAGLTDAASTDLVRLAGPGRGTAANNDNILVKHYMENSNDTQEEFNRIALIAEDVTFDNKYGGFEISTMLGDSLSKWLDVDMEAGTIIFNKSASDIDFQVMNTNGMVSLGVDAATTLIYSCQGSDNWSGKTCNMALVGPDSNGEKQIAIFGSGTAYDLPPIDGDGIHNSFMMTTDDPSGWEEFARETVTAVDVTKDTEDGRYDIDVIQAGTLCRYISAYADGASDLGAVEINPDDVDIDVIVSGDDGTQNLVVDAGANTIKLGGNRELKRHALAGSADSDVEDACIFAYTSTAAAYTLTLKTADMIAGRMYIVMDESGAANTHNITIDTEGAELINGAASVAITTAYGAKHVYSNGSNWFAF